MWMEIILTKVKISLGRKTTSQIIYFFVASTATSSVVISPRSSDPSVNSLYQRQTEKLKVEYLVCNTIFHEMTG